MIQQKAMRLAERLNLLECAWPSQTSQKGLAALLACSSGIALHTESGSPDALYGIVQWIKSSLAAVRAPTATLASATLMVYPADPHALPQHIYDAAYPDEGPINKHFNDHHATAPSATLPVSMCSA